MPMPRLTSMPGRSSRAMRLAMMVCASIASPIGNEVIDDRGGGYDVIGCDHSNRNDMIGGHDNRVRGQGDHWVKITSGECVGEIAGIIGEEGVHQGKIGTQGGLQQIA